jgi:hypothetical protein
VGDAHESSVAETAPAAEAAQRVRADAGPGAFGTSLPTSIGPGGVLALQRTIGNAAVSRLVAARTPALMVARLVDPDSPEYVRGYNDGRANQPAVPAPLSGDALANYEEGYRRGKAEAEAAGTSNAPVEKPAPETPAVDVVTFTNPELQQVFDANKPGTAKQLAAMRSLDRDVKGVWSKLTWATLAKSAAQRIYNPNMMAQGGMGTCGPATILNFLGTNDPGAYASLVIEVYRDGTGGGKSVNSKLRDTAPLGGMDSLDWMLMSAVQDVTNDWYDFHGTAQGVEPKHEGTGSGDQRWAYKHFAGVSKAETIDTPEYKDVLPAARRVNGVVSTKGVAINMHVSAAVLQNPTSATNTRNHVIRLLRPITIVENADDTKSLVEFDAFTWGQVFHWKGTVNQFIHMMWAFTIAATSSDAF